MVLPPGIVFPFYVLPVIRDGSSDSVDRRHSIALNMSLADNPSQPDPDDKHKDDQPPHAQAQESSPEMRGGSAGIVATLHEWNPFGVVDWHNSGHIEKSSR